MGDHNAAACAPGPDLGGDQVVDRDVAAVELGGDAEVKIGRIGDDGEDGAAAGGFAEELAVFAVDFRNVADDLDEADDAELGGIDDGFDAGGLHAGSGAAEEAGLGEEGFEMGDEGGGVEVARGFSGGDEDVDGATGHWWLE